MSKRIVICSDGTWNQADQRNPSNVIKAARAIAPTGSDGKIQIVFYDQGVGTEGGIWNWLLGGVIGKGLDKNVEDGYRFLIHNYVEGDDIFLLGFSRGAFTVRSLAGLIRNSGLLHKLHADKIPDAIALYRGRDDHPNSDLATRFRGSYSREIRIKFIGVWDTVGAMGIPGALGIPKAGWPGAQLLFGNARRNRYQFHDTELSGSVENGYHALAIDEKRMAFQPTLWDNKPKEGQVVEQVWFPGVHSDVGGGYSDTGLSDAAFIWMTEKAELCGLAFDKEFLNEFIKPNPLGPLHNSMSWIYELFGPSNRILGQSLGKTESVHQGVVHRWEHDPSSYRPDNLAVYRDHPDYRVAD